jgi:tetratricopeptide (TPR) repeat protein
MYQERDTQQDREQLEELLGRWAELVDDQQHRLAIQCKRAQMRMQFMGDAFGAVDLLGAVLGEEPGHAPARQLLEELLDISEVQLQVVGLLEPIYVEVGDHHGRIRVLHVRRGQAAAAGAIDEATSHLLEIARIEEHELNDAGTAFEAAREAYLIDPRRLDTLEEVERLGLSLNRERDLLAVWTKALDSDYASDKTLRIDLTRRIAQTLDERLKDSVGARGAYMALLDLEPPDVELAHRTVAALCRLHLEAGDFIALVATQRALLRFTDSPAERVRIRLDIARYQLQHLLDRVGAALTWSEVLDMEPGNAVALDALEYLFTEEEEWQRLTEVLEHRIGVSPEARTQAELHKRIGDMRRQQLANAQGAINAFQSVLDLKVGREESVYALQNLAEINRELERWPDVEETLRRLTALADRDGDRVELLTATAEVVGKYLGRGQDSLDLLKRVLDLSPTDARARSLVAGYMEPDDTHERAIRILLPLYEAEQNWASMLELQELQAKKQPSGRRRLQALLSVAQTQEDRLQDVDRAFGTLCAAFVEAADQPELADILEKVERLGAEPERAEQLYAAYAETVDHILDSDLQHRVLHDIGDVALLRLAKLDEARAAYQRILETRPEDAKAADALEQIYVRQGDAEKLAELLSIRAEREDDVGSRDQYLTRAAEIAHRQLDKPEDAIAFYERLSVDGLSQPAVQQVLEPLYEQTERWEQLAKHLQRRLETRSGTDLVEAHLRLGRLQGEKLSNPDEGIRHLSTALRLDPDHAVGNDELGRYLQDESMRVRVAEVLEPVFAAVQDWPRLVQVQEIKLEEAADEDTRVRILLRVAQIYEEQLEDLERALEGFSRIFKEQPGNRYVRDQLSRLSGVLGQDENYANLLSNYVEESAGDERDEVLEVVREAADLWARGLKNYEKAVPLYRRLLEARPETVDVFQAMEQALISGGLWNDLIEAYWREVDGSLDEERQVDLLMKLSNVALNAENKPEEAARAFQRVLELKPEHGQARTSLERVLERNERFEELLDLLRDRLNRTDGEFDRVRVQLQIAELQNVRLDDPEGSIDTIEALLREAEDSGDGIAHLEQMAEARVEQRARIFDIVEPQYRTSGNTQRIVAVVEWRLTVVEDPATRHELYQDLARLLETMEGGLEYAFRALSRAVAEPGPADALAGVDAELDRLVGELKNPGAYSDALVAAAAAEGLANDDDRRLDLLVRAGRLQIQVGDPARAVEILRSALELNDEHDEALALIDDALVRLGYHEELQKTLERRIEVVADDAVRIELYRRLGTLLEDVLVQTEVAEKAWRGLLEIEPSDREALQRLSRSYEASGSTSELVEVLQRRIESNQDADARRDLRMQLASIQREANKDRGAEVDVLRELLSEAPSDDDAMAALARALVAEERWAEAADTLQDRATVAATNELKGQLMLEAARLYAGPMEDRHGAVERYEQVLQLSPGQEGAISDLVGLCKQADVSEQAANLVRPQLDTLQRYGDLAEVLAARAELSDDPDEQITVLRELASLRYERLADQAGAYGATMQLVDRSSGDDLNSVLQGAARLASELSQLEAYVEELGTRVADEARDPEARVSIALAASWAATEGMGDKDKALSILRPLLEADIADVNVCDGIETLAGGTGDLALASRAIEEGARLAAGSETHAERLVRLGQVRLQLGQAGSATEAFRDALDVQPGQPDAVSGLEQVMEAGGEEPPGGVLDTLETAYQATGDREGLARLTRARLSASEGSERIQLLQNLAQISEEGGGSVIDAIEAWGQLLAHDAESQHAIERLVQLAGQHQMIERAGELMLAAIGAAKDDGRSSVPLSLACARLELDMIGNPSAAIQALAGVLDDQPDHPEGLEMLVSAARAAGDPKQLHEALTRAAQAQGEPDKAASLWREAAEVAESQLEDPTMAIENLTQLIDNDENDGGAWQKLMALQASTEQWEPLADSLGRRAMIATEESERRELRYRLANLYVEKLDKIDDAIGVYSDMIGASPDDATAISELEVLYRRLERWTDVRELLDRKLEAVSGEERVGVFEDMARVAENRLEDLTDAAEVLGRLLEEHPSNAAAEISLERILAKEERWIDLAEILERRMNHHKDGGDMDGYRGTASQLAELLAGKLDDSDRAQEILNGLLEVDPVYVPAIISLAAVYEARGDEGAMRLTLQRAADLDPQGAVGASLALRMASLADDPEREREQLEKALTLDPANAEATKQLLEVSRKQGKWDNVVYLLELAAGRAEDPEDRRKITLERVDVMAKRIEDTEGALRVLAAMYEQVQDDNDVNQRIADALFKAERLQEAAGMYAWLVDVAGQGKRTKVQAHNLTRLARIELAASQLDEAQQHLDDAYRMDTTNVETLLTLGSIHEQDGRWSDALKIYRAMLLQNAEQSGLLRRGDIYMRLSVAHLGLDEKPKAQAMLRRGIEEDPEHPQLKRTLDELNN